MSSGNHGQGKGSGGKPGTGKPGVGKPGAHSGASVTSIATPPGGAPPPPNAQPNPPAPTPFNYAKLGVFLSICAILLTGVYFLIGIFNRVGDMKAEMTNIALTTSKAAADGVREGLQGKLDGAVAAARLEAREKNEASIDKLRNELAVRDSADQKQRASVTDALIASATAMDELRRSAESVLTSIKTLSDRQVQLVRCETTTSDAESLVLRAKDCQDLRVVEYPGSEDLTVWVYGTREQPSKITPVLISGGKVEPYALRGAALQSLAQAAEAYNRARTKASEAKRCVEGVSTDGASQMLVDLVTSARGRADAAFEAADKGLSKIEVLRRRIP